MKILTLLIFLIFLNNKGFSNEVEVIELHENKSLDQIVLDKIDDDISSDEDLTTINASDEIVSDEIISDPDNESKIEEVIEQDNFWSNITSDDLKNYLNNSKSINSKTVQKEFYNFLENANLDYNVKKDRDIFYQIINYFYETGNISKSYNLIKLRDFSNDENISYYYSIEINYLLSTFQLDKVCLLKNDLNENILLENFLLDKIDIFCLVLQNQLTEAELLNSILLETEKQTDINFQNLYQKLIINDQEDEAEKIIFNNLKSTDLIFLYSAMARIAELPLSEDFLKIDSKNLSIPIILNQASPLGLRIMAANESFNNNDISIDSLAALYQSVDFTSNQLNNPENTIKELTNNKELLMAFYFQLINIQIFPSERLAALINFWEFAKEQNLEEIAYSLTYKIIQSIEISSDNLEFSSQIATSYIYNNDLDRAQDWVAFYENSKSEDETSSYIKILLSLYSSQDIDSLIDVITKNFDKFSNSNNKYSEELIFVLFDLLNKKEKKYLSKNYQDIFDDRLSPSIYISESILNSIENNNQDKFLLYSTISLNNRHWPDIHPNHLKLIIGGYLDYNNGELIKDLIIEIFKSYKIL